MATDSTVLSFQNQQGPIDQESTAPPQVNKRWGQRNKENRGRDGGRRREQVVRSEEKKGGGSL